MTAADAVSRVVDALEALNIPYMVVGSFSTNVYGSPRSTKDADFVVEMGATPINSLAAAIGKEFVLEQQMSFETITATSRHRFRHERSAFLIELFLLSEDPHDRARFERRVTGDIGAREVFVPTAEDVIIVKLRWSRHGGRQKDVDDVLGVLRVQAGKLDVDYVRSWCDRHGTRELFERLLAEA
ncbi:MAG TPA: hypothetical protein VER17_12875 [Tepidisphaeraceae bacterium]|nr:hypothetical protein [Tepidisphaeraceae bacterium]